MKFLELSVDVDVDIDGFGLCRKIQRFPLPLFLTLCSFSNIIKRAQNCNEMEKYFICIMKNVWFGCCVLCVFVVWYLWLYMLCHSLTLFLFSFSLVYIFLHKTFILYIFDFYVVLLLAVCCWLFTITWTQQFCVFFFAHLLVCIKKFSLSFFILVSIFLSLFLFEVFVACMLNFCCCFYERDVRSRDSCVWSFKVFRIWKFIYFLCCFLSNLIYIIHSWNFCYLLLAVV